MSLTIVPTPLGHVDDLSQRSIDALTSCEVLILEEFREGTSLLKRLQIPRKEMHQLNEHSRHEDIQDLVKLCREKEVALISDCGTPNFCDPGALLVKACRAQGVQVNALPGPSSLMLILSLSSERLDEFVFKGFLPAKTETREKALQDLKSEKRAMVLMDTPYRLKKLLGELANVLPHRKALLGLDLTSEKELVVEDLLKNMSQKPIPDKGEFILLIYP